MTAVGRRCRRVLITGGQGFAGRHLVHHWLAADEQVTVVASGRSPQLDDTFTHTVTWAGGRLAAPLPPSIRAARDRYRYQSLDLVDTEALTRLLVEAEIDTVVHLAGSLRDEPFEALMRNNLGGTRSLLEAAVVADTPDLRLVVCSSGSVYGAVPTTALPISEEWPASPIDAYSVTKRAAEDLASVYRRAHGLDVVVARLFNVIGAGEDERHLAPSLARQFAERMTATVTTPLQIGPLDTTRDFVDVEDVAVALVAIAGASGGRPDLVNVASGRETGTRQVFEVLAELAGVAVVDPPVPSRPARQLDFARQCADVTRLRALGAPPRRPLRGSLQTMLDYYVDIVCPAARRAAAHEGSP